MIYPLIAISVFLFFIVIILYTIYSELQYQGRGKSG